MTHFKITAIAPTSYQINSLRKFGMAVVNIGNGSFLSEEFFYTQQDAKDYLYDRAMNYYDEYEGQFDEHLEDINNHGQLTIDGVTAHIEEVEEDDEL